MPNTVQPPGWEGYCRFTAAGVYTFFCQAHGGMEGTVVVGNPTPTPDAHGDADRDRDADGDARPRRRP